PAAVTALERDVYRIFVDGYERDWRANVGPFALRVAWRGGASAPVDVDLRLAPFSREDSSAWAPLAPFPGAPRLASGRTSAGAGPAAAARAAVAIGTAAEPRRWIRQLLAPAVPGRPSSSDWLGDWAMAGVDESPAAALTGLAGSGHAGVLDLAELLRPVPVGG